MKLHSSQFWTAGGMVICCLATTSATWAQQAITPDGTLNTNVTSPDHLNFTIEGGTQAGGTLFHSFSQFSVPTGGSAYFNNASHIDSIISRVTGGSASTIDGLLRTNGTANLFLINPNGIIFGPNARLDIGGSFLASTASAIQFADGTEFSTTAVQASPLLTISVPIGLQYNTTAAGIEVQGSTLAVQPGHMLALVGSNLTLDGSTLTAASGRIELGGVAAAGTVGLTLANSQWQLSFPNNLTRSDIAIANGTLVTTSGIGGGDIQLIGSRITIQDSRVEANTLGSQAGGNLIVNASDSLEIVGNIASGTFSNGLFAETRGTGNAGDMMITTRKLIVRGEARVSAATFGEGQGGDLTVNAADSVELIGIDPPIDPETSEPNYQLFTGLLTDTEGAGNAGKLEINTERLIVRDGAQVSASTFGDGNGGDLTVNATKSVELLGVTPSDVLSSGLFTTSDAIATGNPGNLTVNTGQLIVEDGAQIFAGTLGVGNGGNLTVNASDFVELAGVSPKYFFPSGLFNTNDLNARGNAGELTVNTRRLIVRDGAQVGAQAFGTGQGGNLTVNATDLVQLIGVGGLRENPFNPGTFTRDPSGLFSNTRNPKNTQNSGGVVVNTRQLIIQDQAQVSVDNDGLGSGGNITIKARSIQVDNAGSINARTASGEGGNIDLRLQDSLLLRHGSSIVTDATGGTGNGGNITLQTDTLAALENSDITANAKEGRGGNVQITTQGIFGTQVRELPTPESDITATGLASGISGQVIISTPDIDPSQGLITLPTEVVSVEGLIASGCSVRDQASSRFTVIGRGGLPANPNETLSSEIVLADWGTPAESEQRGRGAEGQRGRGVSGRPQDSKIKTDIVEAQGWYVNDKGEVVLTDRAREFTLKRSWVLPTTCHLP